MRSRRWCAAAKLSVLYVSVRGAGPVFPSALTHEGALPLPLRFFGRQGGDLHSE